MSAPPNWVPAANGPEQVATAGKPVLGPFARPGRLQRLVQVLYHAASRLAQGISGRSAASAAEVTRKARSRLPWRKPRAGGPYPFVILVRGGQRLAVARQDWSMLMVTVVVSGASWESSAEEVSGRDAGILAQVIERFLALGPAQARQWLPPSASQVADFAAGGGFRVEPGRRRV